MSRQVYNPFLPLHEYIPDGEPHIFGDRVYLYGSHDKEGGHTFCMLDYVAYSAPVDDLTDWRYEGVIYRASQDRAEPQQPYLFAPDVVQGKDGRYYLYYCMGGEYGDGGYQGPIRVAVCDSPAGTYEYLGYVRNPDGTPMRRYICFDPAVLNDAGCIRLYYGTQYVYEEIEDPVEREMGIQKEIEMFGRTREELMRYPDSIMGPVTVTLQDDMLTIQDEPRHIIPYRVKGTSFAAHPFFEGASMRKVGEKYYFIYSSWQNHELCYAISDKPDSDFMFGGTIVSNGDVGFAGRKEKDRLNMTGTTHGSIVCIKNQWYVFYHRLTHKSDYSRQACAEKIKICEDGTIPQVEITSCGLQTGPLCARGVYPAVIACNLTNGNMPHGSNSIYAEVFPHVTHQGAERFIAEITNQTWIGYKYFSFCGVRRICLVMRRETEENRVVYTGPLRMDERSLREENAIRDEERHASVEEGALIEVRLQLQSEPVACIKLGQCADWTRYCADLTVPDGVYPLYLTYQGAASYQLKEIEFCV